MAGTATDIHPLDMLRSARWSRALFGTYALSLGFFEAAPLHALRRAGASDIRLLADVTGVAGALGEAGAREVGRSYALEPVRADDGCFHAKFMLLDGETGPRMAIGSGNLTFGGWGRNLELVELLSPASASAAFADMADFLAELGRAGHVTSAPSSTLSKWSATLRGAAGTGGPRVLHSLRVPLAEQIAGLATELGGALRLTVASPYYGRARAVARLAGLLGLDHVHVHVPARLPLGGEHFDFDAEPTATAVVVEELDEASARPMHAKLIEVACRDATLRISGSVNASGPALATRRNVELAVVRTTERRLALRPTAAPPRPPATTEGEADGPAARVLTATLVGMRLSGQVLDRGCEGAWSGRLDATGEFRDLGRVEVDCAGRFAVDVAAADEVGFGSRRAILALDRGVERISGFVTFPDLIDLSRRYGARAGSILRVVNGSDEDEDLAGALEYFASHAEEALAPWRHGAARRADVADAPDDRTVSLDELEIRPRMEADPPWTAGGGGAGAMERLLAALRRTIWSGRPGQGRSAAEDEEDARAGDRAASRPERSEGIFELLRDALETRVPDDPVAEMHRLADLGVFVLYRRPDAERFAEFATWWTRLAAACLRCPPDRDDLRLAATVLILVDALPRRASTLARHRLASIVGGDVGAILASLRERTGPHRLERLIDEATAGREALLAFAGDVAERSSTLEELPLLVAAIRAGAAPPPLPSLDPTPEMARVRARIAAGFADRIQLAARSTTSCPRCRIGLAQSDIARLRALGIVIPNNCCSRAIVVDMELA